MPSKRVSHRVPDRVDTRFTIVLLACAVALPLSGQSAPRIALGLGVDTTGGSRQQIFTLWRAYLSDRPDSAHPNPYWSAVEQRRWRDYDLAAGQLYFGADWPSQFRVTVAELDPAVPGDSTTYLIRTLYARVDSTSGAILPLAVQRVYAVRENNRWVLSNALPRLTSNWPHRTVGRISFIYWPGHRFDRRRAARSARFVDSLAHVLGVAPPRAITYIMAPTPDELVRILGLDFGIGLNGLTLAADGVILSGFPAYGEWYPHELVHLVMDPLVSRSPVWLLNEGAATWFGGSRGLDYPGLTRELAGILRGRPQLTLDSIVAGNVGPVDSISRTAGAVLYEMAYEHGGIPAVRELIGATAPTPDSVYAVLEHATGLRREDLRATWRRKVMAQ